MDVAWKPGKLVTASIRSRLGKRCHIRTQAPIEVRNDGSPTPVATIADGLIAFVPREWPDASFDNLRAEGAFAVSARREGGRTVSVTIKADQDGHLRLRDPFAGAKALWNRRGVSRRGADYECSLARGQVIEGRFA